jgi:2-polyprenyl-3-methyl-5-hydroxy-6-metoxy-1,4-benzoquinol methylase
MTVYHSDEQKQQVDSYFSGPEGSRRWLSMYEGKPVAYFDFVVRERMAKVLDLVRKNSASGPRKILDIGCGSGEITVNLLKAGHTVQGVDYSECMVQSSRLTAAQAGFPDSGLFLRADVEHLPHEKNTFDIVICVGVLSYLSEVDRAVDEIRRVLKKDGIAIMTFRNKCRLTRVFRAYDTLGGLFKERPDHLGEVEAYGRYDIPWRINRFLEQRGFAVTDYQGCGYGPIDFGENAVLSML